jgi:hypothetical protein
MLIPPSNFLLSARSSGGSIRDFLCYSDYIAKSREKAGEESCKKGVFFLAGICGFCGKYQKTAPLSERGRFNLYHANTMDQLPKLGQYRTNARMCIGREAIL